MKKQETVKKVNEYLHYANSVNVHVIPTKKVNSGAHGRAYEQAVKLAIGNYRFNGIAKPSAVDTIKKVDDKKATFEIKTGCGELGNLDANGNIINSVFKRDYIIYSPEYTPTMDVLKASYVLTGCDFLDALRECGLIRYKKSSNMTKQPKELQYNDKMAIQSFTNSKKKLNQWYDALATYGTRLDKWLSEKGL